MTSRRQSMRGSAVKGPGEALAERAQISMKAKSDKVVRDMVAATTMLKNKENPKISGDMLVFNCGFLRSSDVKRWINLDPEIGILSVWKEQPCEDVFLSDVMMPARSHFLLCGVHSGKERPLIIYKMFDLIAVDCNKSFLNIFLEFDHPRRVLVLTAPTFEDFVAWLDALSKYAAEGPADGFRA
eukprot:TRINITY_DN32258_c0_g1_i1.p1 TRINITY_DN32258_c0_g1~~TRINITY_DN32258_c0_g1_i1.p1  ORF type:complete len:184 (+),score=26.83 TRINITY_DN32258_c0_g1_i1:59-610(+)